MLTVINEIYTISKIIRSGDFTARIWKLPGGTTIMADENGKPIYDEPAVLKHSTKVRRSIDRSMR